MKLNKYKYYLIPVSLILLEVIICIYAVNKGASNTDEFTTLLNLRFQKNLIMVDFYNMLYILSDIFFDKITVLSLRWTKYIFALISVSTTCLLLFPVLIKKYQIHSKQLFLIAFTLCTGAIITMFNRSICYNDLMDHFSVWCICILYYLVNSQFKWLRFLLLSCIYLAATFFLFGIKFPLAMLAIAFYIFTVSYFLSISNIQKTIISILFLTAFLLMEHVYIITFYKNTAQWLYTYQELKNIFYTEDLPIYLIDIIVFAVLLCLVYVFDKKIESSINYFATYKQVKYKILILWLMIIILAAGINILLINFTVIYILYYLAPSFILVCMLIYAGKNYFIRFIRQPKIALLKSPENYIFLTACIFFIGSLAGSYTLQLVNIGLHTYMVAFLFTLLFIRQKQNDKLIFVSGYLFVLFIVYSIFNPFLYSNKSLFSQTIEIQIKNTGEQLYVDHSTKLYFEKIESIVSQIDTNQSVINIDHSNVLYYLGAAPFMLPNILDEQSASIFHKEILATKKLGIQSFTPRWILTSNAVDTAFYAFLKDDLKVNKNKLILKIKNPGDNIFKDLKSDGYLYIYDVREFSK